MEFGGLSDRAVRHMDVAKGSTITGIYGYAVSAFIVIARTKRLTQA